MGRDMRRLMALGLVTGVVVAGAVGVRLEHVHEETGQWGLLAWAAAPARISTLDRSYDRSRQAPETSAAGYVREGETKGGGTILVPAEPVGIPLVVYVRDRQGRLWTYGLVGGP